MEAEDDPSEVSMHYQIELRSCNRLIHPWKKCGSWQAELLCKMKTVHQSCTTRTNYYTKHGGQKGLKLEEYVSVTSLSFQKNVGKLSCTFS